jgi:hypothetical protein
MTNDAEDAATLARKPRRGFGVRGQHGLELDDVCSQPRGTFFFTHPTIP